MRCIEKGINENSGRMIMRAVYIASRRLIFYLIVAVIILIAIIIGLNTLVS